MGGLNSGPGPGITLLIAIILVLTQTALSAPVHEEDEGQESNPQALAESHGCYYNFQHYNEGERILTNEPCLNCTCRNRMLMCYLRVCPFTKGIGQNCTVEKVPGQCCPIITCPEVPVQLLTSSTTEHSGDSSRVPSVDQGNRLTAVGHLDHNGCNIDGIFYPNGAQVPGSPEKPCELCYCIRNKTACIMQECALNVDGCRPVYEEGQCFPVRYQCDDSPYEEEPTTTVRPPPTPLLMLTTPSSDTSEPLECTYNNDIYTDGSRIKTEDPCEHCYCLKGKIACAVQECGAPLEKEGQNCTALPPAPGKCCPDSYRCDVTMSSQGPSEGSQGTTETGIPFVEDAGHPTDGYHPDKFDRTKPTQKPTNQFHQVTDAGTVTPKEPTVTDGHTNHDVQEHVTTSGLGHHPELDKGTQTISNEKDTEPNNDTHEANHPLKRPTTGSYDDKITFPDNVEYDKTQSGRRPPGVTEGPETDETTQTSTTGIENAEGVRPHDTYGRPGTVQSPIFGDQTTVDPNIIHMMSEKKPSPESDSHKQDDFTKRPLDKEEEPPYIETGKPQTYLPGMKPSGSHTESEIHQTKPQGATGKPSDSTYDRPNLHNVPTANRPPTTSDGKDPLIDKLHNIIQDVQNQVNDGKTTEIPEVDYQTTMQSQKGHFTDRPDSLSHHQPGLQDTETMGVVSGIQTDHGTGNMPTAGPEESNDILNKLQGIIHGIYSQVTESILSTIRPGDESQTTRPFNGTEEPGKPEVGEKVHPHDSSKHPSESKPSDSIPKRPYDTSKYPQESGKPFYTTTYPEDFEMTNSPYGTENPDEMYQTYRPEGETEHPEDSTAQKPHDSSKYPDNSRPDDLKKPLHGMKHPGLRPSESVSGQPHYSGNYPQKPSDSGEPSFGTEYPEEFYATGRPIDTDKYPEGLHPDGTASGRPHSKYPSRPRPGGSDITEYPDVTGKPENLNNLPVDSKYPDRTKPGVSEPSHETEFPEEFDVTGKPGSPTNVDKYSEELHPAGTVSGTPHTKYPARPKPEEIGRPDYGTEHPGETGTTEYYELFNTGKPEGVGKYPSGFHPSELDSKRPYGTSKYPSKLKPDGSIKPEYGTEYPEDFDVTGRPEDQTKYPEGSRPSGFDPHRPYFPGKRPQRPRPGDSEKPEYGTEFPQGSAVTGRPDDQSKYPEGTSPTESDLNRPHFPGKRPQRPKPGDSEEPELGTEYPEGLDVTGRPEDQNKYPEESKPSGSDPHRPHFPGKRPQRPRPGDSGESEYGAEYPEVSDVTGRPEDQSKYPEGTRPSVSDLHRPHFPGKRPQRPRPGDSEESEYGTEYPEGLDVTGRPESQSKYPEGSRPSGSHPHRPYFPSKRPQKPRPEDAGKPLTETEYPEFLSTIRPEDLNQYPDGSRPIHRPQYPEKYPHKPRPGNSEKPEYGNEYPEEIDVSGRPDDQSKYPEVSRPSGTHPHRPYFPNKRPQKPGVGEGEEILFGTEHPELESTNKPEFDHKYPDGSKPSISVPSRPQYPGKYPQRPRPGDSKEPETGTEYPEEIDVTGNPEDQSKYPEESTPTGFDLHRPHFPGQHPLRPRPGDSEKPQYETEYPEGTDITGRPDDPNKYPDGTRPSGTDPHRPYFPGKRPQRPRPGDSEKPEDGTKFPEEFDVTGRPEDQSKYPEGTRPSGSNSHRPYFPGKRPQRPRPGDSGEPEYGTEYPEGSDVTGRPEDYNKYPEASRPSESDPHTPHFPGKRPQRPRPGDSEKPEDGTEFPEEFDVTGRPEDQSKYPEGSRPSESDPHRPHFPGKRPQRPRPGDSGEPEYGTEYPEGSDVTGRPENQSKYPEGTSPTESDLHTPHFPGKRPQRPGPGDSEKPEDGTEFPEELDVTGRPEDHSKYPEGTRPSGSDPHRPHFPGKRPQRPRPGDSEKPEDGTEFPEEFDVTGRPEDYNKYPEASRPSESDPHRPHFPGKRPQRPRPGDSGEPEYGTEYPEGSDVTGRPDDQSKYPEGTRPSGSDPHRPHFPGKRPQRPRPGDSEKPEDGTEFPEEFDVTGRPEDYNKYPEASRPSESDPHRPHFPGKRPQRPRPGDSGEPEYGTEFPEEFDVTGRPEDQSKYPEGSRPSESDPHRPHFPGKRPQRPRPGDSGEPEYGTEYPEGSDVTGRPDDQSKYPEGTRPSGSDPHRPHFPGKRPQRPRPGDSGEPGYGTEYPEGSDVTGRPDDQSKYPEEIRPSGSDLHKLPSGAEYPEGSAVTEDPDNEIHYPDRVSAGDLTSVKPQVPGEPVNTMTPSYGTEYPKEDNVTGRPEDSDIYPDRLKPHYSGKLPQKPVSDNSDKPEYDTKFPDNAQVSGRPDEQNKYPEGSKPSGFYPHGPYFPGKRPQRPRPGDLEDPEFETEYPEGSDVTGRPEDQSKYPEGTRPDESNLLKPHFPGKHPQRPRPGDLEEPEFGTEYPEGLDVTGRPEDQSKYPEGLRPGGSDPHRPHFPGKRPQRPGPGDSGEPEYSTEYPEESHVTGRPDDQSKYPEGTRPSGSDPHRPHFPGKRPQRPGPGDSEKPEDGTEFPEELDVTGRPEDHSKYPEGSRPSGFEPHRPHFPGKRPQRPRPGDSGEPEYGTEYPEGSDVTGRPDDQSKYPEGTRPSGSDPHRPHFPGKRPQRPRPGDSKKPEDGTEFAEEFDVIGRPEDQNKYPDAVSPLGSDLHRPYFPGKRPQKPRPDESGTPAYGTEYPEEFGNTAKPDNLNKHPEGTRPGESQYPFNKPQYTEKYPQESKPEDPMKPESGTDYPETLETTGSKIPDGSRPNDSSLGRPQHTDKYPQEAGDLMKPSFGTENPSETGVTELPDKGHSHSDSKLPGKLRPKDPENTEYATEYPEGYGVTEKPEDLIKHPLNLPSGINTERPGLSSKRPLKPKPGVSHKPNDSNKYPAVHDVTGEPEYPAVHDVTGEPEYHTNYPDESGPSNLDLESPQGSVKRPSRPKPEDSKKPLNTIDTDLTDDTEASDKYPEGAKPNDAESLKPQQSGEYPYRPKPGNTETPEAGATDKPEHLSKYPDNLIPGNSNLGRPQDSSKYPIRPEDSEKPVFGTEYPDEFGTTLGPEDLSKYPDGSKPGDFGFNRPQFTTKYPQKPGDNKKPEHGTESSENESSTGKPEDLSKYPEGSRPGVLAAGKPQDLNKHPENARPEESQKPLDRTEYPQQSEVTENPEDSDSEKPQYPSKDASKPKPGDKDRPTYDPNIAEENAGKPDNVPEYSEESVSGKPNIDSKYPEGSFSEEPNISTQNPEEEENPSFVTKFPGVTYNTEKPKESNKYGDPTKPSDFTSGRPQGSIKYPMKPGLNESPYATTKPPNTIRPGVSSKYPHEQKPLESETEPNRTENLDDVDVTGRPFSKYPQKHKPTSENDYPETTNDDGSTQQPHALDDSNVSETSEKPHKPLSIESLTGAKTPESKPSDSKPETPTKYPDGYEPETSGHPSSDKKHPENELVEENKLSKKPENFGKYPESPRPGPPDDTKTPEIETVKRPEGTRPTESTGDALSDLSNYPEKPADSEKPTHGTEYAEYVGVTNRPEDGNEYPEESRPDESTPKQPDVSGKYPQKYKPDSSEKKHPEATESTGRPEDLDKYYEGTTVADLVPGRPQRPKPGKPFFGTEYPGASDNTEGPQFFDKSPQPTYGTEYPQEVGVTGKPEDLSPQSGGSRPTGSVVGKFPEKLKPEDSENLMTKKPEETNESTSGTKYPEDSGVTGQPENENKFSGSRPSDSAPPDSSTRPHGTRPDEFHKPIHGTKYPEDVTNILDDTEEHTEGLIPHAFGKPDLNRPEDSETPSHGVKYPDSTGRPEDSNKYPESSRPSDSTQSRPQDFSKRPLGQRPGVSDASESVTKYPEEDETTQSPEDESKYPDGSRPSHSGKPQGLNKYPQTQRPGESDRPQSGTEYPEGVGATRKPEDSNKYPEGLKPIESVSGKPQAFDENQPTRRPGETNEPEYGTKYPEDFSHTGKPENFDKYPDGLKPGETDTGRPQDNKYSQTQRPGVSDKPDYEIEDLEKVGITAGPEDLSKHPEGLTPSDSSTGRPQDFSKYPQTQRPEGSFSPESETEYPENLHAPHGPSTTFPGQPTKPKPGDLFQPSHETSYPEESSITKSPEGSKPGEVQGKPDDHTTIPSKIRPEGTDKPIHEVEYPEESDVTQTPGDGNLEQTTILDGISGRPGVFSNYPSTSRPNESKKPGTEYPEEPDMIGKPVDENEYYDGKPQTFGKHPQKPKPEKPIFGTEYPTESDVTGKPFEEGEYPFDTTGKPQTSAKYPQRPIPGKPSLDTGRPEDTDATERPNELNELSEGSTPSDKISEKPHDSSTSKPEESKKPHDTEYPEEVYITPRPVNVYEYPEGTRPEDRPQFTGKYPQKPSFGTELPEELVTTEKPEDTTGYPGVSTPTGVVPGKPHVSTKFPQKVRPEDSGKPIETEYPDEFTTYRPHDVNAYPDGTKPSYVQQEKHPQKFKPTGEQPTYTEYPELLGTTDSKGKPHEKYPLTQKPTASHDTETYAPMGSPEDHTNSPDSESPQQTEYPEKPTGSQKYPEGYKPSEEERPFGPGTHPQTSEDSDKPHQGIRYPEEGDYTSRPDTTSKSPEGFYSPGFGTEGPHGVTQYPEKYKPGSNFVVSTKPGDFNRYPEESTPSDLSFNSGKRPKPSVSDETPHETEYPEIPGVTYEPEESEKYPESGKPFETEEMPGKPHTRKPGTSPSQSPDQESGTVRPGTAYLPQDGHTPRPGYDTVNYEAPLDETATEQKPQQFVTSGPGVHPSGDTKTPQGTMIPHDDLIAGTEESGSRYPGIGTTPKDGVTDTVENQKPSQTFGKPTTHQSVYSPGLPESESPTGKPGPAEGNYSPDIEMPLETHFGKPDKNQSDENASTVRPEGYPDNINDYQTTNYPQGEGISTHNVHPSSRPDDETTTKPRPGGAEYPHDFITDLPLGINKHPDELFGTKPSDGSNEQTPGTKYPDGTKPQKEGITKYPEEPIYSSTTPENDAVEHLTRKPGQAVTSHPSGTLTPGISEELSTDQPESIFQKTTTPSEDDLINKLHNIISGIQSQVTDGKTTVLPPNSEQGVTSSVEQETEGYLPNGGLKKTTTINPLHYPVTDKYGRPIQKPHEIGKPDDFTGQKTPESFTPSKDENDMNVYYTTRRPTTDSRYPLDKDETVTGKPISSEQVTDLFPTDNTKDKTGEEFYPVDEYSSDAQTKPSYPVSGMGPDEHSTHYPGQVPVSEVSPTGQPLDEIKKTKYPKPSGSESDLSSTPQTSLDKLSPEMPTGTKYPTQESGTFKPETSGSYPKNPVGSEEFLPDATKYPDQEVTTVISELDHSKLSTIRPLDDSEIFGTHEEGKITQKPHDIYHETEGENIRPTELPEGVVPGVTRHPEAEGTVKPVTEETGLLHTVTPEDDHKYPTHFDSTDKPLHVVYPTYYPDGVVTRKPGSKPSLQDNGEKVTVTPQTNIPGSSMLDSKDKTDDVTQVGDKKPFGVTTRPDSPSSPSHTLYDVQTQISSEAATTSPVIIVEEVHTEIHSERATTKPGTISYDEHTTKPGVIFDGSSTDKYGKPHDQQPESPDDENSTGKPLIDLVFGQPAITQPVTVGDDSTGKPLYGSQVTDKPLYGAEISDNSTLTPHSQDGQEAEKPDSTRKPVHGETYPEYSKESSTRKPGSDGKTTGIPDSVTGFTKFPEVYSGSPVTKEPEHIMNLYSPKDKVDSSTTTKDGQKHPEFITTGYPAYPDVQKLSTEKGIEQQPGSGVTETDSGTTQKPLISNQGPLFEHELFGSRFPSKSTTQKPLPGQTFSPLKPEIFGQTHYPQEGTTVFSTEGMPHYGTQEKHSTAIPTEGFISSAKLPSTVSVEEVTLLVGSTTPPYQFVIDDDDDDETTQTPEFLPPYEGTSYVPYKIVDGTKVYYPDKEQPHPPSKKPTGDDSFDGFDYMPFEVINGTKFFFPDRAVTETPGHASTTPSPLGMYVPYKILNGTKIYFTKDPQGKPYKDYDGLDYLPFDIVNGTKVFYPERVATTTPAEPMAMYVPYKLVNGTKVFHPKDAQHQPQNVPDEYDGFELIPYEIVNGTKLFRPDQISTPAPVQDETQGLFVPFKLVNGTKVFYPKDAKDEPKDIPDGYDGFEYIPYEIVNGKKVFHPEKAQPHKPGNTRPQYLPSMYVPYKLINGKKVYYPKHAQPQPQFLPKEYEGYDLVPYEIKNGTKFFYPDRATTERPEVFTVTPKYQGMYIPYKLVNGTKMYHPKHGQEKPFEVPEEYDGFDFVPYDVVNGTKVFYPERITTEKPSGAMYLPYKIIDGTKVFYADKAQHEPEMLPDGYDGYEYVPYEIINGTKYFYPDKVDTTEFTTTTTPIDQAMYVPYKIVNGSKVYYPKDSTKKPQTVPTDYDGVDYIPFEIINGTKVFYPDRTTTSTPLYDIIKPSAMYVPYKLINGTKVYYVKDAKDTLYNLPEGYDGFDYIPFVIENGTKVFRPEAATAQQPIQSPGMFVPYKVINGTKVYYPKEAHKRPHPLSDDYHGLDYIPYEVINGSKVFYPERVTALPTFSGIPLTQALYVPYKIINGTKVYYPKHAQQQLQNVPEGFEGSDYIPYEIVNGTKVFDPEKAVEIETPFKQAMYVPFRMINGTKTFYPEYAQQLPHLIPEGYDGFEYIPYEIVNGVKVFKPEKVEKPFKMAMYVPYKKINGTKVFYPKYAQQLPHLIPEGYDGYEYLPYKIVNGTKVFEPEKVSKPLKPAMYVPYKIINGTKVFYPKYAQPVPSLIPGGYDGFDYIPYHIVNGTKVFEPEKAVTTESPFRPAMYVPFRIINGQKVFYPKFAQQLPHLIPEGYDGFEYLPYEIVNGTKIFEPEKVSAPSRPAMYVPFRIVNGTKVFYPKYAQKVPSLIPEGYDGFEYLPYDVVDGTKVFDSKHPAKPIVEPQFQQAMYVPYKIIKGVKVFYPKYAQHNPQDIPAGYDGFDYIPYEIVNGNKVFDPEKATGTSPKQAMYVPYKIVNGTKVYYPKHAKNKPNLLPEGYDGFDYLPYDVINGTHFFYPNRVKPQTPYHQAMYVPYKIINGKKVYYPKKAQQKPQLVPEGFDGFDQLPFETVNGTKVFNPKKAVPGTSVKPGMYVPYKRVDGTKIFYPKHAQEKPYLIPDEYDGFDYIPYDIVNGTKVFDPQSVPGASGIQRLRGMFVPYKVVDNTKIFYPKDASEKSNRVPEGYDGLDYVPYEPVNNTKVFYPELISNNRKTGTYVPFKLENGKKVFAPEEGTSYYPVNRASYPYGGVAYVPYKSTGEPNSPERYPTDTSNESLYNPSEIVYVDEEEFSKPQTETYFSPMGLVPGEGSCLLNNRTFGNNSEIPAPSRCQTKCKCVSSVIQCVRVKCPKQPAIKANCTPAYRSGSCCPTYDCGDSDSGYPTTKVPGSSSLNLGYDSTTQTPSLVTRKPSGVSPGEALYPSKGKPGYTTTERIPPVEEHHIQRPHRPSDSESVEPYDNVEGHPLPSEFSPDEDYDNEDEEPYGPGTCRYAGKVYVSAQQIPRDDPCDFCFCFRSDIICLQQSCPPPIPGCRDEPIQGFCCPRYECHVKMATLLNVTSTTTTTTTTLPPHFFPHAYKGSATRTGCFVQGKAYRVGQAIPSASGPCMDCTCGGNGRMKCEPKVCTPEPMIRKMIVPSENTTSPNNKR